MSTGHPHLSFQSSGLVKSVQAPLSDDKSQECTSDRLGTTGRTSPTPSLFSPPPSLSLKFDGGCDSLTTTSDDKSSTEEKGGELTKLPPKRYNRFIRTIRWTMLSVYGCLNILTLVLNVIPIIILVVRARSLLFVPETSLTAVAANLTLSVLIRQDMVVNLLFWSFGKLPHQLPLRMRCLAAKVYHLGGVHSGAAIAATLWFVVYNVVIIIEFQGNKSMPQGIPIIIIVAITDVLLIGIIAFAHPNFRIRHHNTFEAIHRYAGWTTVALFWVLFGLRVDSMSHDPGQKKSKALLVFENPVVYLLLIITASLVQPWIKLRRVRVDAEPLSDRAILLRFTHTSVPICSAPRISRYPLGEWHAFAGIGREGGKGFSLMVAKAGDWTGKLIQSPPSSLWVRGMPARGVLHCAVLFKKVVLVATGSGIGPILSLLRAPNLRCRILWSTPDPNDTYQHTIIDHVLAADPEAMIINTSKGKRPDLTREAYKLYTDFQAEAVFIISNQKVTGEVVYNLESRGIPAFAPIFDS